MIGDEFSQNLGTDIEKRVVGNFKSLQVKSLKEMYVTFFEANLKGCIQYRLDWNAVEKDYEVQFFEANGGYTYYRTVACS